VPRQLAFAAQPIMSRFWSPVVHTLSPCALWLLARHHMRATIAGRYDVASEEVFVGNGSDEVLAHIFQALLKHDAPLLFPDITCSFRSRRWSG
jgi:histidinol-phosphate/aromatic aminotransferase/cobyric acid decarboxylase-like protein